MKIKVDMDYVIVGSITAIIAVAMVVFFHFNQKQTTKRKQVLKSKRDYIFGIDVSHYQGHINWNKVKQSHHPIEFVFVRSTMGVNGNDQYFNRNWRHAKELGFMRGAYHYFRPNEPGLKQFENFKQRVRLERGDLPPVIDIEEQSKKGNNHLIKELKVWLTEVESHYGVKPIIYTGHTFYNTFLKGKLNGYTLWIADYNYGSKQRIKHTGWSFHQFTDQVRISGIKGSVDGNDYAGKLDELSALCLN